MVLFFENTIFFKVPIGHTDSKNSVPGIQTMCHGHSGTPNYTPEYDDESNFPLMLCSGLFMKTKVYLLES